MNWMCYDDRHLAAPQMSSKKASNERNSGPRQTQSTLKQSFRSTYLLFAFDPLVNGNSRGSRTVLQGKNRLLNQCNSRHGYSTILSTKGNFLSLWQNTTTTITRKSRGTKKTCPPRSAFEFHFGFSMVLMQTVLSISNCDINRIIS